MIDTQYPFAVCEKIYNNILLEEYCIEWSKDTDPARFMVLEYFKTYKEASEFLDNLLGQD